MLHATYMFICHVDVYAAAYMPPCCRRAPYHTIIASSPLDVYAISPPATLRLILRCFYAAGYAMPPPPLSIYADAAIAADATLMSAAASHY